MASFLRENKTIFFIIITGLLLLELEIFALAVMKSGKRNHMQVRDDGGRVILRSEGSRLTEEDRQYLTETFGPIREMEIRLVAEQIPFPFRAWFAAAMGLPVGAMLIFAFLVRAYATLSGTPTYPETPTTGSRVADRTPESGFERTLAMLGRLNIFAIGGILFLSILAYWIVPNAVMTIGRLGVHVISQYRWVFLGLGCIVLGVFLWIVHLRYRLAVKAMESRYEIEKLRLQLACRTGKGEDHPGEALPIEDNEKVLLT